MKTTEQAVAYIYLKIDDLEGCKYTSEIVERTNAIYELIQFSWNLDLINARQKYALKNRMKEVFNKCINTANDDLI